MALADKLPPPEDPDRQRRQRQEAASQDEARQVQAEIQQALREEDEDTGGYELDGEPPTPEQAAVGIHTALARARADMPKVGKKDRYDAQGTRYNFRGVDRVVNASRPVLARHGISVWPELLDVQRRDVPRANGGRSTETLVRVAYHVVGPLGDTLPAPLVVVGEALDTADKGAAKAMSVAWRVMLIQLLHIATGDPDPDSMMIERGGEGQDPQVAQVFDPNAYAAEALRPGTSHARLNQMVNDLQRLGHGTEVVSNEHGEPEKLGPMIFRLRNERRAREESDNG